MNDRDHLTVNMPISGISASQQASSTSPSLSSSAAVNGKPQAEDNGTIHQILRASSHPRVLIAHLFFRSLALVLYLLSGLWSDQTIIFCILVIVLSAFDFWVVKNITGRLLVGMRWWNDADAEGHSSWVFEAKPRDQVNKTDSMVFWWTLYLFTAIWSLLLVFAVIRLKFLWSVIVIVAITLNSANVVGYTKCDRDAKSRFKGFVSQGLMNGMMQNALGSWVR
eukprot:Partr_v1_DN24630_c0_g1_i1_m59746 putative Family with sequence similarity 18, member